MSNEKQVPSVGRMVHYVAYGTPGGEFPAGAHRAAIITQIDNIGLSQQFTDFPEVSLCVLNPTGLFFNQCVPFDPTGEKPGSWHWLEYVPAVKAAQDDSVPDDSLGALLQQGAKIAILRNALDDIARGIMQPGTERDYARNVLLSLDKPASQAK